jgi:hypothetical protein
MELTCPHHSEAPARLPPPHARPLVVSAAVLSPAASPLPTNGGARAGFLNLRYGPWAAQVFRRNEGKSQRVFLPDEARTADRILRCSFT